MNGDLIFAIRGKIENCQFTNCSIADAGIRAGSATVIKNCAFTDCNSHTKFIHMTNQSSKAVNCSFINLTTENGYIFYTWDSSIIGSRFYKCTGCNATIALNRGMAANCSFTKCKSVDHYNEGCIALLAVSNITGSNFTDCYNSIRTNSNATIDRCNFIDCHNVSINVQGVGNTAISNSNFTNSDNSSISLYPSNNSVTNCKFVNCSSTHGGAIRSGSVNSNSLNNTVRNCTFINCFANESGGAIWSFSTLYAYDSSFLSCHTTDKTGKEGSVNKVKCTNCIFGEYIDTGEDNGTGENNETNIGNNTNSSGNGNSTENNTTNTTTPTNGTNTGDNTTNTTTNPTGNETSTNTNSTQTVNKIKKSTKLIASSVTATYSVSKKLIITLKDANNRLLKSKKITVKVGSISKTLYTNAKGQVTVLVSNLVPKSYLTSITFAGDSDYTASKAKPKVIVKKAKPKIVASNTKFKSNVKTKKYTITLKNNKGKVMKSTIVILKVKGKTYKVKTNKKGKATFKITNLKKKGNYKASITYSGNKYYNKISKNIKITVK